MTRGSILLVDDESNILSTVRIALEAAGFEVAPFLHPLQAREALRERFFDLALYDLKMQPIDGIELLRETRVASPFTTVMLMTAHGSIDTAVEAIKQGAYDYLQKPFEFADLQRLVERAFEHHSLQAEVRLLRDELGKRAGVGEIVTRNATLQGVVDLALKVAPGIISVLIEGESGTGKEVLARLIHKHSGRAGRPFVTVTCGALAETLLESELFGHARGSFTGAVRDRQGRFEAADGGTIFLDEIGDVAPQTQVKLLRFLQSKEFERVGETATRKVDVRVLAATNKDLEAAVTSGAFREDLFYRLNAVRLKLPSLRERTEDIPLLVQHFIAKSGRDVTVSPGAQNALAAYPWRGNVRELENIIERALILSQGTSIEVQHLPDEFHALADASQRPLSLEDVEQRHIVRVLRIAKDLDEAANILGIDPTTLWRKRKKYGL